MTGRVRAFIRQQKLFAPGDRVLLGVSGGPDSLALLHILYRLKEQFNLSLGVAHFEHGLRGQESLEDAAFVAAQAAALDLPCYQERGEVHGYAQTRKLSLQVAARRLRSAFFDRLRQAGGYNKLALGHTADDQVELFFLRLLRGAGPEGLKGMWPHSPNGVVRPLLAVRKAEILAWLARENLPYRQDASNLSPKYRRNRLRLELLPELARQYNPRLSEAVWRAQALLQEQEAYLAAETARQLAALGPDMAPGQLYLDLDRLLGLHPYLQKRVLRLALTQMSDELAELSYPHLEAARALAQQPQPSGEIALPGGWRLQRRGRELVLQRTRPPQPPAEEYELPGQEQGCVAAFGWTLEWTTSPGPVAGDLISPPRIARLDRSKLHFPLIFRLPRPGDRFQPLGMTGHKKLQDFFVDAKIPRHQRPWIPVLLSQGQIIWIVGQRLAEPVKVTPETTTILCITARRS